MNIQLITAIASALALANASSVGTSIEEQILYAAYHCRSLLLRGPLIEAKNKVGGRDRLDICFRGNSEWKANRLSTAHYLGLRSKSPFRAMLQGARKLGKSSRDLVDTYKELQNYTFRQECKGDDLLGAVFEMPEYGIETATELIKSGASPLVPHGASILSRAFQELGNSAKTNAKVLLFVDAVLADPANVQLLKIKGCNPIHELASHVLTIHESGLILEKLLAKGFHIDAKAIEGWVCSA